MAGTYPASAARTSDSYLRDRCGGEGEPKGVQAARNQSGAIVVPAAAAAAAPTLAALLALCERQAKVSLASHLLRGRGALQPALRGARVAAHAALPLQESQRQVVLRLGVAALSRLAKIARGVLVALLHA